MPYSVGERGSYGCSGYPVVKDGTNEVMGCHDSAAMAQNQITAINMSEAESSNKRLKSGVEGFEPASRADSVIFPPIRRKPSGRGGSVDSAAGAMSTTAGGTSMGSKSNYNDNTGDWFNAKPIPETSAFQNEVETRNNISREIGKEHMEIKEGEYVMGNTTEGVVHGRVEHIMREGGTLGQPGTEYAIQSMPPENPAMSVRVFEYDEEEKGWEATAYSIGMMYQDAKLIDISNHIMPGMESDEEMEELERLAKASPCWEGYVQRGMKPGQSGQMVPNCVPVQKYHEAVMRKAESYSPNDGMKSAARRALKWKADGKATGAGTPVGWGRATDIVAGRSMSLSTVKRMFSFFSRHEAASKGGKDFNNTSNPSNGRIMWDAWGGDAGFTWSKAIVERNRNKFLFSDFGKDVTKTQRLTEIFKVKGISVGDHVMFGVPKPPDGTSFAHGKVERVERSGTVSLPNSGEKEEASSDNPVAVVRVWATKEGGGYTETDRRVVKPFSSLRVSETPLEKMDDHNLEKVSSKVESRLRELAEEYNKGKEGNKKITVGALKQVYNRGIGAYRTNSSSVRPNVTSAEQWAMGRVNAFMKGLRGRFPRSAFDLDLFPSGHPRSSKGSKD